VEYPWDTLKSALIKAKVGKPVYTNWPAKVVAPCLVLSPGLRRHSAQCEVTREIRMQAVTGLQQDQQAIHDLTEAALAALPAGFFPGDTTYSQQAIGGVDYVFAVTLVTHKQRT
jgi:hypothetical protein